MIRAICTDDNNKPKEVWKDVPGYEGLYQVSDLGRVKSLSRIILKKGLYPFVSKEKILITNSNNNNYHKCDLCKEGDIKPFKVHQLVAMAFLGHIPDGRYFVVDHINNNRDDNSLKNLQIVDHRYNISKDRKKGTSKHVGVSWNKPSNQWIVSININKNSINLGRYNCEITASNIYQKALKNKDLFDGCNKSFREKLKSL